MAGGGYSRKLRRKIGLGGRFGALLGESQMEIPPLIFFATLGLPAYLFAQASSEAIDKALLAAPPNLRDGATVIKWKADFTYETLRKGTNRLVCYDRSGQAEQQPFMIECTSLGNL